MNVDIYTKSILVVLAIMVVLNVSTPSSHPISQWSGLRDSVGRLESNLLSVSSSIMAVAVLVNAINPWGRPFVALAQVRLPN